MEILKSAAILVIGFVLLIKGADFFVEEIQCSFTYNRYDYCGNGN